jgi:hypothetical protein
MLCSLISVFVRMWLILSLYAACRAVRQCPVVPMRALHRLHRWEKEAKNHQLFWHQEQAGQGQRWGWRTGCTGLSDNMLLLLMMRYCSVTQNDSMKTDKLTEGEGHRKKKKQKQKNVNSKPERSKQVRKVKPKEKKVTHCFTLLKFCSEIVYEDWVRGLVSKTCLHWPGQNARYFLASDDLLLYS